MSKQKGTTFNCFSPPVMVATLLIEFSLAAYTIWRYKLTLTTRLIVGLLVFLGAFQLAEYFVCTGSAGHVIEWSQFGFLAITALPPLGLHLMHVLAGKKDRRLVYSAYATMLAFMLFFLLNPEAFTGHQCAGNYVIFQFSEQVSGIYSVYYFGWVLAGIGKGAQWAQELKDKGKQSLVALRSVQGLIAGYLVFLVPAATVHIISPESRRGIPSVLCGFAILLALTLALYILPKVGRRRKA
jgi:hypothetical protein